jgi:hypothetical protein
MQQTNTIIIGASVAGLATAACLRRKKIPIVIIEQSNEVATPWRNHYLRLHLHTNKRTSHLPYKKFAAGVPRYPTREEVVAYLDDYSKAFDVSPLFGTKALAIQKQPDGWITETTNGSFQSKHIVIATGAFSTPKLADFSGIETFTGTVLHSTQYKTGSDFKNQQVLVIGFGNSACEIAMDLHEQGAHPCMSVRNAVNIVPREVAGIPLLELTQVLGKLPPRLADQLNKPLLRLLIGDITKLGLRQLPYGPMEQIKKDKTIPVIDIGVVKYIRKGYIKVLGAIKNIQGTTVYFENGEQQHFDAIIAAIGYETGTSQFVPLQERGDDYRKPIQAQQYFGKDGLYTCGFNINATGLFHEIAKEAKIIAADIANQRRVG